MIEESWAMLTVLLVGIVIGFSGLIIGKVLHGLWRWIADRRESNKMIERENQKQELVAIVSQYRTEMNKRIDRLERAIYPLGPSKPLDEIPKDVPRAPEVEG